MNTQASWRALGDALAERYARSAWRLPALLLGAGTLSLGALYLIRGLRTVRLGLVGVVAAAGAAVCFAHPFPTLVAAVFLSFSTLDVFLPGPVTLALLGLVLARVGFDALSGKRFDWGSATFGISLAALLAIATTSLLVARSLPAALAEGRVIALGLAFYLAISQLADRTTRLVTLLVAISLGLCVGTLVALRALLAAGGAAAVGFLTERRIAGTDWDANVYACFADCMIPILIHLIGRWRGRRGIMLLPVLVFLIGSVVASSSRAGVLVMGVVLMVLLLRARRYRWLTFVGLAVLGVVLLMLPSAYWVRFESFAQFRGIVVDRSLQLRQHALAVSWSIFVHHPWLGVGLGNLQLETPRFMMMEVVAHNAFLEIAASLGVFGLLAYAAWLWSGFSMAHRAAALWRVAGRRADQSLAEALILSLLVFCAMAMTLSIPFYHILWMLLGLANAARGCAESGAA